MPAQILVVDDSAEVRSVVDRALRGGGFEVVEAANGADALKFLATNEPDLMILDLMMPGINGFQVLDALRTHPRRAQLPTIITTGTMTGPDDFKGTPVVAVLRKPFTLEGVLSLVREVISRRDFERSSKTT